MFGLGVHDFAKKQFDKERIPQKGYTESKSYGLSVTIVTGTKGSDYESDATITHDLWGNAPQDPRIWTRVTFGNTEIFEKK